MNPIDKAWNDLLESQMRAREAMALAQADQRHAFYLSHKRHFDDRSTENVDRVQRLFNEATQHERRDP